ncbi:hypothetical protein ACQCVP_07975 [Rossellomorea vietnamensis]|uniref:hypothetical protein n=1 Tax=Rossellomorea vietnamensis TaxID=218284 RepID=UPI003CEFEE74
MNKLPAFVQVKGRLIENYETIRGGYSSNYYRKNIQDHQQPFIFEFKVLLKSLDWSGMRMFRKITTLIVSLILLTACNSKDVSFAGESDSWEAELKIIHNSDTFKKEDFVLRYKGEDIDSVGDFAYEVDSISSGFGREGEGLGENGSIRHSRESRADAIIPEDAEIEVTVEWNGNTETFTLTR